MMPRRSRSVDMVEPRLRPATATDPMSARTGALVLCGLTLLGAAVRAFRLDAGLWYDEIVTLVVAVRLPIERLLTEYPTNNHHPLYSLLGHVSIGLFGEQAWSLRLPAYVFGVASIPMLYRLGTLVSVRLEAVLAAGLLSVSYHHVWFSQNARGYTALMFWTLLCTDLLLRGLATGRVGWYVGYAIAAALGAYAHLTMGFVVAAHGLWCAWRFGVVRASGQRCDWGPAGLGFGLTAALTLGMYGPLVVDVQRFFASPPTVGTEVATRRWALLAALRSFEVSLGTLGALIGGLLLVVGLWSYLRRDRQSAALFVLPGLLTVVGIIVLQRPTYPRFFFFLIGFGTLAVVRGARVVGAWAAAAGGGQGRAALGAAMGTGLALVLIVVSATSLGAVYRYPKQDFQGALEFVERARGPRDAVAVTGTAAFPYRRYFDRPWEEVETAAQLEAAAARAERVWVLYTFPRYIEVDAPGLMAVIRRDCEIMRTFRGTVGGGDVVVCTLGPPLRESARP